MRFKAILLLACFFAMGISHAQSNGQLKPTLFAELNGGVNSLNFLNAPQEDNVYLYTTGNYYDSLKPGFVYGGAFGVYFTKYLGIALAGNFMRLNKIERNLAYRGINDSLYFGDATDKMQLSEIRIQLYLKIPISEPLSLDILAGVGFANYSNQRTFFNNQLSETGVGASFATELRLGYSPVPLVNVFLSSSVGFNLVKTEVTQSVYANPNLPVPYLQDFSRVAMSIGIQYHFLSGDSQN